MEGSGYYEVLDEAMRQIIRKDLAEDPKKLNRQLELFKEWLRCESYLPKDVDERLIRNFVRLCKCDLQKAKQKFENFLLARVKFKKFYLDRDITDTYFENMLHRRVYLSPKLTPDGCRLAICRLPEDPDDFDFDKAFRYTLLLLDFVLLEDEFAGYIVVNDLKYVSPQILGKVNIKLLAHAIKLIYSLSPLRFKAVHFINVPYIPESLIVLMKKLVPQKLIDRVYGHKNVEDLRKYIPTNLLPKEYAGDTIIWNEITDKMKEYFINNKRMKEIMSKLELKGEIPQSKGELYSFEDYEMGGSFRQLSID